MKNWTGAALMNFVCDDYLLTTQFSDYLGTYKSFGTVRVVG